MRRKFRGMYKLPGIGYGSAKATKHMMPSGFRKVHISLVTTHFYLALGMSSGRVLYDYMFRNLITQIIFIYNVVFK